MRTYETTFRSKQGKETDAECYEIGRLQGETFGWIDGHGTFKPTTPGHYENPGDCPSPERRQGARREPRPLHVGQLFAHGPAVARAHRHLGHSPSPT